MMPCSCCILVYSLFDLLYLRSLEVCASSTYKCKTKMHLFQVSSKPLWQQTYPAFHLGSEEKDDQSDGLGVKNHHSSGKVDVFSSAEENLPEIETHM